MARRKGFSLVEVLVVLMVFGMTTGILCARLATGGDDTPAVRAEAEALAEWLTYMMTRARFEGRGFAIEAHRSWGEKNITRLALKNNGSSGGGAEYYAPKEATMDIAYISPSYIYDSDQHTLTPAVSINFRSKKFPEKILYTVTVSGQGYISVRPRGGTISKGA